MLGANLTGADDEVVEGGVERPREAGEVESRSVWMAPAGPLVSCG
jgi:hypothetical protein